MSSGVLKTRRAAVFWADGSVTRSKTAKVWLRSHLGDFYVKRSKLEGFRSRAAYKLLEIDARDRLLRPGMTVVDLGAAPGGWSQVAAAKVAPGGRVIAVDLIEMSPVAGVDFVRGDVTAPQTRAAVRALLGSLRADLVISDMSPNISGVAVVDQARILSLVQAVLEFAAEVMKPEGGVLVKTFQGADYAELRRAMCRAFDRVVTRKPSASRDSSREVYLLGKGRSKTEPGSAS
jgi:23S rRNA (uridine2552-2'-O)-methyltransferase